MNTKKFMLPLIALLICGVTIILFSFKAKVEKQICYGVSVTTESLHNVEMGQYDPKVYGRYANAWFRKYILTVKAPSGWHFTGEPYVNCVKDDQGAFGWNNFSGAKDRFYVTQRTPTFIETTCWAGSRSIIINLACEATKD